MYAIIRTGGKQYRVTERSVLSVEKLPGGRYTFSLHVFTLAGYHRGDERRVLAQLDDPLAASVTAEGGLSGRAAPAAAPAARP